MFPIIDYVHVAFIYMIVGVILWLPPIIFPQWKRLVRGLNRKEIAHRKQIEYLFFIVSIVIIIITIIIISLFNTNLFHLDLSDEMAEYHFFTLFAGLTFTYMPIALGIYGATIYFRSNPDIEIGNFFILLVAFSAIALAGAFYHDFLWCGTATQWYTIEVQGGYDLDTFVALWNIQNRDYQLLGAAQGTLSVILIIYAAILLWKFNSFRERKLSLARKVQIAILILFIVVFYGFFLFIIDAPSQFDFNVSFHSLFIGLGLICFLFYCLGNQFVDN